MPFRPKFKVFNIENLQHSDKQLPQKVSDRKLMLFYDVVASKN